MFNEDELKVYDKKFQAIGILDKEEQKKILEFFYTLGVITFNLQLLHSHSYRHNTFLYE